ncbi:MAG: rubredoxin [candidate division Zixibacteria bacterium]|nr:rubredoxin [candidate division Zixibacteria bacterium]
MYRDLNGKIAPGTKFVEIPDDWECPIYGVDKTMFIKIEE